MLGSLDAGINGLGIGFNRKEDDLTAYEKKEQRMLA